MTPQAGEAIGALGATGVKGESSQAALLCAYVSTLVSVSAGWTLRALPCASRVNVTSPPPCAKSAPSATSASDFDSVSGSAVTSAARESSLRRLCFA
eukprot:2264821-Pleurochrysis_carterae.AAC.10